MPQSFPQLASKLRYSQDILQNLVWERVASCVIKECTRAFYFILLKRKTYIFYVKNDAFNAQINFQGRSNFEILDTCKLYKWTRGIARATSIKNICQHQPIVIILPLMTCVNPSKPTFTSCPTSNTANIVSKGFWPNPFWGQGGFEGEIQCWEGRQNGITTHGHAILHSLATLEISLNTSNIVLLEYPPNLFGPKGKFDREIWCSKDGRSIGMAVGSHAIFSFCCKGGSFPSSIVGMVLLRNLYLTICLFAFFKLKISLWWKL